MWVPGPRTAQLIEATHIQSSGLGPCAVRLPPLSLLPFLSTYCGKKATSAQKKISKKACGI